MCESFALENFENPIHTQAYSLNCQGVVQVILHKWAIYPHIHPILDPPCGSYISQAFKVQLPGGRSHLLKAMTGGTVDTKNPA